MTHTDESSSSDDVVVSPSCVLDPIVLNERSVHNMTDMGLSIFAVLCGENRGAFVLFNSTYSCLNLPEVFAINAGIDVNENLTIAESNDIKTELLAGTITGSQAIDVLAQLNTAVYASSANVASDPFACNLNGLNMLDCSNSAAKQLVPQLGDKIRSVALASALTPALWDNDWNLSDAGTVFYQQSDLDEIAAAGLNVVVIAVPLSAWHHSKKKHHVDELDGLLDMVRAAQLQVILELVNDTEEDDEDDIAKLVEKAADYAESQKHEVVLAVQVPDVASISAARHSSRKLPLLVPLHMGQLQHLDLSPDPYLFGTLQLSHTSTVADIASSTILDDRMKLFYHESVSCMQRAPIEYAACYHDIPVLVSGLTDLSIDNCALVGTDDFVDYGQCGRFNDTVASEWWYRHRQSLAMRQLFAAEQGLGWTYPAWKLWGDGDKDDTALDGPAKLLSLKAVLASGLVPDLNKGIVDSACLNPPETDFILGDATLSPTPGPPPDCGNGWWNYTIEDCSYWVPPPTDSPVACPVCDCSDEAPVVVNTVTTTNVTVEKMEPLLLQSIRSSTFSKNPGLSTDMVGAFVAGAVLALVLGSVWPRRRTAGYERIPENHNNDTSL